MVNEEPRVPVDDEALNVLSDALDYHFVGEDEDGDPIGSGPFSFYDLMRFWSGYDPALETVEGSGIFYRGQLLGYKDVIKALIEEIRRLRSEQV